MGFRYPERIETDALPRVRVCAVPGCETDVEEGEPLCTRCAEQARLSAAEPKPPAKRDHVYFAGEPGPDATTPIKIGTTQSPRNRLSALQSYSPVPLVFLAVVQCRVEWQAELHELFADARQHGEWFARSPELMRLIEAAKQGIEAMVDEVIRLDPPSDEEMGG